MHSDTAETELIRRRGPCKGLDDVELATLESLDWFTTGRLHSACGDIPPHRRLEPEISAEASLH